MKEGIQAIIQQINLDAVQHGDQKFAQLKNELDRELERERALFQKELDQHREVFIKHTEQELKNQLERLSRRLNRELLTYRHELLDEIFDMAVSKLKDISEQEFADIFISAVKGHEGSYTLYIGEYSRDKLDARTVSEAVKASQGLEITISGDEIPRKSGFLLRQSGVEYNYLFEDLIEDKRSEQSAAILKEVFE